MAAVDLNDRFFGGEGNPPLIILHGLLGSSRNWNAAGRDLTEAYAVTALDQRNHGQSPHTESHTYTDLAEDLEAWLDARGLESVSLMGHSMGGKAGMVFSCSRPERVNALFIADISPREYDPHYDVYLEAMQAIEVRSLTQRKEAEAQLEATVSDWAMRQFLLTNLVRDPAGEGFRWQVNIPTLLQELPDLSANPLGPEDRFSGHTLFLKGGKSDFIHENDRAKIREHFPQSHLVTLKEAGHNVHVEDRETFVQAVLKAKDYFEKHS